VNEHRQKLQLIHQYLDDQFAGATITPHETSSGASKFVIEHRGMRYELQVDDDLLNDRSGDDVRTLLSQWAVRDELCRAEGLPVILTERGVRLASS
jgi:hypothetical protein